MNGTAPPFKTPPNGSSKTKEEPERTLEEWYQVMQDDRFNSNNVIIRKDPTISMGGNGVAYAGDITTFVGQNKAGKSGVTQATTAGSMVISGDIIDTCGLEIKPNTQNKALIHIDTEQSRYDHHQAAMKSIWRASRRKEPDWLESYNWDVYDEEEKITRILKLCEYANQKHGGIYMIIIDGIADFVASVNDEAESKKVVTLFRSLAKKYDCPVVVILHFNPGSDKGRGHLGSFLERKSVSYLHIKKDPDTEISTIETYHMRHSGKIPSIQFYYDVDKGHHVYHGSSFKSPKADKQEVKKVRHQTLANGIFENGQKLYLNTDLCEKIQDRRGIQIRQCQTIINEMEEFGIISFSEGDKKYMLVNGSEAPPF
jgi:hypothetical protein